MPNLKYKHIIRKLEKAGFRFLRQAKGAHEIWSNGKKDGFVIVSHHTSEFKKSTIAKMAKKAGFKNLKDFENF